MRALIVGCGSIGARRARLLHRAGHAVAVVDPRGAEAVLPVVEQLDHWSTSFGDLKPADRAAGYDAAFICTQPDSGRLEQVAACLGLGVRGLFVEKPLALTREECEAIGEVARGARSQGVVTMGACNLRFVSGLGDLRRVKGFPKFGRFVMGQHEKYWSPKHQKISMILDSIHELDLAVHLLGPVESIRGRSDERTAFASVHHANGNWSQVVLDRVHEPPHRSASIESHKDGHALVLRTTDAMYERELRHFTDCVRDRKDTTNPLPDAALTCLAALEIA